MSKLAILGFGTMGQAITSGLLDAGNLSPESIVTFDKGKAPRNKAQSMGLGVAASAAEAVKGADAVLLCVKPKDLEGLLGALKAEGAFAHKPLVVSIAAGVSLGFLESHLPSDMPVVRAMPNTPCSIRMGTIVLSAGSHAEEAHLVLARSFFEPLGAVLELEEHHMDAVTSLSASGPAFIFVILEALAEGGVLCGLPRAAALELASRMTVGAASMVLQSGRHPASLKDDVTTPAGCTIAGLLALEDGRIRSVIARGVEKAAQVAGELGK